MITNKGMAISSQRAPPMRELALIILVGRKGVLIIASCVYVIGVALQTAGLHPAVFVIGRVLLGCAIGFISNVVRPT